jgi:hypothetical protein
MALPSTASAASLITSGKVGCAWELRAISSVLAPNSIATTGGAMPPSPASDSADIGKAPQKMDLARWKKIHTFDDVVLKSSWKIKGLLFPKSFTQKRNQDENRTRPIAYCRHRRHHRLRR